MRIIKYCLQLTAIAALTMSAAIAQSAPTVGRYVDNRQWPLHECMTRGRAALQGEGYVIDWTGADAQRGTRASFTTLVMCSPTPEGLMRVNVVLATNGGNIQAENDRIWTRLTVGSAVVEEIDWVKQADGWRGKNGQRFTLRCKPGGAVSNRVWGSDVYTDDSSICSTAVHAGLIDATSGGVVTIEIRPGQDRYVSTTRYGITSREYGSWSGSFIFLR